MAKTEQTIIKEKLKAQAEKQWALPKLTIIKK